LLQKRFRVLNYRSSTQPFHKHNHEPRIPFKEREEHELTFI